MAATFHLNQSQVFPAGTTVGAYLRTAWPCPSSSVGPSGSAVATAVVADDTVGDATFSGLAYATRYYAAAQVSGSWRWVAFQTAAVNDPGLNDWEARILAGINNAIKAGAATLTYNSDGTLASASTPAVTVDTITYDTQGRISTFRETIDTGVHVTRTLTYDASGNLTAVS